MRVSSPIRPFLSGTLKSTRMKTRWPFSARSLIDSFGMVGNIVEQYAVLDDDGERGQRTIRFVQTAPGPAIELPAVQRALEARALVVHAAVFVRADVRQQNEPGLLFQQKVCAEPFADDRGEPVKRVGRAQPDHSP